MSRSWLFPDVIETPRGRADEESESDMDFFSVLFAYLAAEPTGNALTGFQPHSGLLLRLYLHSLGFTLGCLYGSPSGLPYIRNTLLCIVLFLFQMPVLVEYFLQTESPEL